MDKTKKADDSSLKKSDREYLEKLCPSCANRYVLYLKHKVRHCNWCGDMMKKEGKE